MSYLETYFSRINHMGSTTAERIREGGIRSFYKWMAESPHTVQNLSVERGVYFPGIILTNKDKEYQKIMFLNVSNETKIKIGDILNWKLDDGSIEKWILFQEEKKVNGTYRTFWIIRCNYLLKWIDDEGHLQQSWSYLVSSTDDKVKANFRTWHNMITPQPNKYAEIMMPRYNISRSTNFIVEDESWNVIEYDYTSVPGIIYLSTSENKVNMIYDDLDEDIADLDKKAKYTLALPTDTQEFNVGDIVNPSYSLLKNGIPITMAVKLYSQDYSIVKEEQGNLIAKGIGDTNITVQLVDYPDIKMDLPISIKEETVVFSAYIEGADTIRLDRDSTYVLKATDEITSEITYSIDSDLVTMKVVNNECILHANNKNKLGIVQLTAEYNSQIYTKTISVVPLW